MKIKICFVATYAWALFAEELRLANTQPTPFGGSEIQLYQFANELAKDSNFEISFITGDFGQDKITTPNGIKMYKGFKAVGWSKFTRSGTTLFSAISQSHRLWNALKKADADFYIQRAAGAQTGITAYFCRKYQRKFIYMTASRWDVSGDYASRNGLRGRLFEWGLKHAHQIITQNSEQTQLLSKNHQRIARLIKNAYRIAEVPDADKQYILWVGRAEPFKRPELFLDLARQFPKEQFVMIAQPAVYYSSFIEDVKVQARAVTNLKFIEYVPFKEIDNWFTRSKIFVNTSADYEGFPNTFIQAAINKTPIISLQANPDDFINQHRCGLCAGGDAREMAEYLKELLANPSLRVQIGANGFAYAKANHDINNITAQFKKVFFSKNTAVIIPNLFKGGAERMVSNLTSALPGHMNITLIIFEGKPDYPYRGELVNLNLPASRNPLTKLINLFRRIYEVWRIKKSKNIETTISFLEGANIVNILSGFSRTVVSVRTLKSASEGNKGFYGFIFKWLSRLLYNKADNIIAAAQAIKNDLADNFGIIPDRIKVIPNFLNITEIEHSAQEPLSTEHNQIFTSPVIINVGRLDKPKGQWHLIRAFSRVKAEMPQAKLVMVGAGELANALKDLADKLGLGNDVYFIGRQDNPFKFMARSSLFALSSIVEGFPNVLIEAMACGLPVIAADCPSGPREILAPSQNAEYGVLTPTLDGIFRNAAEKLAPSEHALAEAIIAMLKDNQLLRKYASLAQARAADFTPDKIMPAWLRLIK